MEILGKAYDTTAAFATHLESLKFTSWKPSCIHFEGGAWLRAEYTVLKKNTQFC